DLLTAAAYGVDELLFVYGDRPETGKRSDDLTVAAMVREARAFAAQQRSHGAVPNRRLVRARAGTRLEAGSRRALRPGLILSRPALRMALRSRLRRSPL